MGVVNVKRMGDMIIVAEVVMGEEAVDIASWIRKGDQDKFFGIFRGVG